MKMIDEIKNLVLYSSDKKLYIPFDKKDKKHGSAILLLAPTKPNAINLSKLDYIYNPDLYTSYYIDGDSTAFIKGIDTKALIDEFDEKEETALKETSEGLFTDAKCKFDFDIDCPITFVRDAEIVYNQNKIYKCMKQLGLAVMPDKLSIKIYPTLSKLRDNAPKPLKNVFMDDLYSYTDNKFNVGLISRGSYIEERYGGSYEIYLLTELYYALIANANPEMHPMFVKGIAMHFSGRAKWIKENRKNNNCDIPKTNEERFASVIASMAKNGKQRDIERFIKTGDVNILADYKRASIMGMVKAISKVVFESDLSYFERERLLPSEFGVPDKRKYPLNDEDHVRAAVRMFNHCDPDDEKELAENIIKKMKKFGIDDIKVSAANRFKKYYTPPKSVKEAAPIHNDFDDIEAICKTLSEKELKRITFEDKYNDSEYVIKRIIKRLPDGTPVGFLDLYYYPSTPQIAQIVIAVDSACRGMGIAKSMVHELFNSIRSLNYKFTYLYWAANTDNMGSQRLALSCGFEDTEQLDKYGRKVFLKQVRPVDPVKEGVSFQEYRQYAEEHNGVITESMSIVFNEASGDPVYNERIKKYLFKERIRTTRDILEYYVEVKANNPKIRKTYQKLDMYKGLNLFVDLSYYHSIFLRENNFPYLKAISYYEDFLDRLIHNKNIDSIYKNQYLLIPVDRRLWNIPEEGDLLDFKHFINPISLIHYFVRTQPGRLRTLFKNKTVIFVGSRGYFKVDFSAFDMTNLTKFKTNINKLNSMEPVLDEEEIDKSTKDSPGVIAANMIAKIEKNTSIKLDDISAMDLDSPKSTYSDGLTSAPHLSISNEPLHIWRNLDNSENVLAVVSLGGKTSESMTSLNHVIDKANRHIKTYYAE